MRALLAAALLAPAAAAAAPVDASTASAVAGSTLTVSSLYTGDRVRDPFLSPSVGGAAVKQSEKGEAPAPIDIHALHLRGVLKDKQADFALFATEDGRSLMLRGGRLYDERNKPVPGITGKILLKQKTVQLITADKDVQIFRLGETDEDKKNKEKDAR